MRVGLVVVCVLLAVVSTTAKPSRAHEKAPAVKLPASYFPPAGDRVGNLIRERAWTYDLALAATARTAGGDVDGAGELLDTLQDLQRPDGALDASFDLTGAHPGGPLRSGVQAWVGLAALTWRAADLLDAPRPPDRRDRALAARAARLGPTSPGYGLVRGGPDVSWVSAEHNFEARAFFAGLAGEKCHPATKLRPAAAEFVARFDRAADAELLVHDGAGRAHFRQGVGDDTRPLDVQALGILWLVGQGRRADAQAVERETDETMGVSGRSVAWPGASGQTFAGYRPFAGSGADVLWMEGSLMMRLAKARLGHDVGTLDDSADRWAALTAPAPPLHVDHAAGEDYHVWPAAAAAAWRTLSRSSFAALQ